MILPSNRLGYRAEPDQRVIGSPIGFTAYVGNRKAEIDEMMAGKHEWRVVESLHKHTSNNVRLTMAALARPSVQCDLMLLPGFASGGKIDDAGLAERDIRKDNRARRLVIDFWPAKQRSESGARNERIMNGSAKRRRSVD